MRKIIGVLAAAVLVAALTGRAQAAGCARLSWGTCDPWVENKNYGSSPYVLVYSIAGSSDANVGTDTYVRIRHLSSGGANQALPDSWRFDDSGCQTGSQLTLSTAALNGGCPAFQGLNALSITQYAIASDGSATLRLANTYDTFTPSSGTRYTVWRIVFSHTYSSAGATPPGQSSCGGADLCENFSLDSAEILSLSGQSLAVSSCDTDVTSGAPYGTLATWNGGCRSGGPPESLTWGKLKGTY